MLIRVRVVRVYKSDSGLLEYNKQSIVYTRCVSGGDSTDVSVASKPAMF